MGRTCQLCKRPAAQDDCFVRLNEGDYPACRSCWEQLLLDPKRVLRSLQAGAPDRAPGAPSFPPYQ